MHTLRLDGTLQVLRHVIARSALTMALTAALTSAAHAQRTPGTGLMKEDRKGQLAMARVSPDSARRLARARVAGASIAEEGIEQENGKLVYSFDMRTPGRTGIDEVLIDAMTGAIISVSHEGPKQEAAERAQDARERRARRDSVRKP